MSRRSAFKWCREFKNGHMSVHDDQRSGRGGEVGGGEVNEGVGGKLLRGRHQNNLVHHLHLEEW